MILQLTCLEPETDQMKLYIDKVFLYKLDIMRI